MKSASAYSDRSIARGHKTTNNPKGFCDRAKSMVNPRIFPGMPWLMDLSVLSAIPKISRFPVGFLKTGVGSKNPSGSSHHRGLKRSEVEDLLRNSSPASGLTILIL
ncbi:MAG: hypothetical protein WC379_13990 [Methanoregula sp.]